MGKSSENPGIREFLTGTVLLSDADNLDSSHRARLALIRRDKVERALVRVGFAGAALIEDARETMNSIVSYIEENGIDATVIATGYQGPVNYSTVISVQLPGKNRLFFRNVTPEKTETLINGVFHNDIPGDDLLGQQGSRGFEAWNGIGWIDEMPWLAGQKRQLLNNLNCYEPSSAEGYIARGGYRSFIKTIRNFTIEEVCDIVEASGLRGRSGSGFPTGVKWKYALGTDSASRFMVCNAMESDPGSYTDTILLETQPHSVIEGLAIAAYAIGATKGIIYLHNRSAYTKSVVEKAIEEARDFGLLGYNIFDSGYNLDIELRLNPGAYVCGEETALIGSLEGKRGMPQLKPPYPSTNGYLGSPTIINNPETLANVPLIMTNGPDWFRSTGTEGSSGTKLFFVTGKSRIKGIVEVEMGTTFERIVENICDGVTGRHEVKAVMTGGPGGSLLAPVELPLRIDFDEARRAGITIGSGGLLVIDDDSCLVDLARYCISFLKDQSCGKCIPCREGSGRIHEILRMITSRPSVGNTDRALERFKGVMQMETIAGVMKETSLCGLGQNAPNILIDLLTKFRGELEEHIFDRVCRTNQCRGLRIFSIDVDRCTGCTACASKCPFNAIYGTRLQPYFIVEEKCTGCGICYETCKFGAVIVR